MYSREELTGIINRAIQNIRFDDETVRLFDPVRYMLSAGGKRIRPVMSLMACNIYSDKVEKAVMPALGLELFHNFTLVHDDIMDNASVRRNLPTVHEKWGLSQAILSGDVMAFIASDFISQAPDSVLRRVIKEFNDLATGVCKGQQMDMEFETTPFVSLNDYMRMVELKTAVLIAGAFRIGGLIGGCNDDDARNLHSFGLNLGLAFQIQDDILDTYGDLKEFGKRPGGDIIANKKTILLIKAMEMASAEDLKILQEQIGKKEFDPEEKVSRVRSVYDRIGVKQSAETIAFEHVKEAFSSIERLGAESSRKEALLSLAHDMVVRSR